MCAMNTISVFLATKRTTAGAGRERTARTVRSVHTRYRVDTATDVVSATAGANSATVMNGKPIVSGIRANAVVHTTTNATRSSAAAPEDSTGARRSTSAVVLPSMIPRANTVIQFETFMYATNAPADWMSAARTITSPAKIIITVQRRRSSRRRTNAQTSRIWRYAPMNHVVGLAGKLSSATFTPPTNGR